MRRHSATPMVTAASAALESILASKRSRASRESLGERSSKKFRRAVWARWVWQLMRPGSSTMPLPSTMAAGFSLGASLLR